MRRARRAVLLAAGAALASPIALGQKPARSPVLGILSPFYRPTPEQWARLPTTPAFAQLGWVAGKTLGVEFGFGQGREDLLPELARELVRKRVDVIWARGPEAAVVAAQTTKTIPIVFTAVAWPVEMGLADSLARPGRNSTGVAYIAGDGEQTLKPAEYLRQIAPEATRIVSLWSMHNLRTVSGEEYGGAYPAFESGMRALGFDYRFEDIKSAEGYEAAFANILASRAQAIIALTTALNFRERKRIVDFANRHRLASTFDTSPFVEAGGLVSYGPDLPALAVQSVRYIDRILRGAQAGSLAIELPGKYELAVNVRTAKALGLAVPQAVMVRADRVIA